MSTRAIVCAVCCALLFSLGLTAWSDEGYKTRHVFIVVMDGVRWSDTFGDEKHELIPHLNGELRPQGTLFTHYYNRGITVTRQGHSTLISGTWQKVHNGGPRLTMPTLFEYYRDEKNAPPNLCWAVFGKADYSFLHYSSHPAYGARLAGKALHGGGKDNPVNEYSAAGDAGVLARVLEAMKTDRPDVVFVNFGYTDHAGHIAKEEGEYRAAIENCDEQMGRLWQAIQADPHYRDTTTVFFTNDHGRHSADFHSHGDHCEGCEHIMLLVLGPDTKRDTVVDAEALPIDVAPTAAELLGLQTPLATGRVLGECLTANLGLNQKQARTETARNAVELERLAGRDLVRTTADWVLANLAPAAVPATPEGEVVVRGMLRAHAATHDPRFLQYARVWIEAHKTPQEPVNAAVVGNVVLDLPEPAKQELMGLATRFCEPCAALPAATTPRAAVLEAARLLGRVAIEATRPRFRKPGLDLALAAAAAQPPAGTPLEAARDLALLGQAAAVYPGNAVIAHACIVASARALKTQNEEGALWDDPAVSVLNLIGIGSAARRGVFKGFVELKGQDPKLPELATAVTDPELVALFPEIPAKQTPRMRRQLVDMIARRGKQSLAFSADMLRYGVNAAGAFGDGSPEAQGGFLLAYQKLDWRYGGNVWPGEAPKPAPAAGQGPK